MKSLQKGIESAAKILSALAQKLEVISQQLEERDASKPPPGPEPPSRAAATRTTRGKRAPQKTVKKTASDTVLQMIKRSKQPVDMAAIEKKTGFEKKKIQSIVYRLKKQGKIKSVAKGRYETV
jgi:predicted Rossmann fold nucleotide-binding protein DprA/Smf involved in DNA uptake